MTKRETVAVEPTIAGRIVRGLTLWRPWPWAILHADKRVENREWPAPRWMVGQWLAIHAGKRSDRDALVAMREGDFGPAAMQCPIEHRDSVIEGVVELLGVGEDDISDPWSAGPYCWRLGEPVALPEPVPCRGAQGLWKLPPDVFELVRDQVFERVRAQVEEPRRG